MLDARPSMKPRFFVIFRGPIGCSVLLFWGSFLWPMLSTCAEVSKIRDNYSIFSNTGCTRWGQTSSSMNVHKPYKHTRSHAPAPRSAAAPGATGNPPAPRESPAGVVPRAGRGPCYRLFIRPLPRYGLMDRFEGGLFIVLFPAHTPYLVC